MSGKLHLICMSYNYNFFFIHSYSVFLIMFSLKNTFPANNLFRAFRL